LGASQNVVKILVHKLKDCISYKHGNYIKNGLEHPGNLQSVFFFFLLPFECQSFPKCQEIRSLKQEVEWYGHYFQAGICVWLCS